MVDSDEERVSSEVTTAWNEALHVYMRLFACRTPHRHIQAANFSRAATKIFVAPPLHLCQARTAYTPGRG